MRAGRDRGDVPGSMEGCPLAEPEGARPPNRCEAGSKAGIPATTLATNGDDGNSVLGDEKGKKPVLARRRRRHGRTRA